MKASGEIVKIPLIGFDLDSAQRRRERVYTQVRGYERWTSAAVLAKASYVPTTFVEEMLREGLIVPKMTGPCPNGYLVREAA